MNLKAFILNQPNICVSRVSSLSKTYVVAGNGTSLAAPHDNRILASDKIVRTNNFFFEHNSYLGTRVDLAVMGGDPRVAPFMFETLWQCRKTYDISAWCSHNPRVQKAGKRRFAASFTAFPTPPGAFSTQLQNLIETYQCKPMTGTYAALAAFGQGAEQIILTGFDLYQSGKRYTYDVGRRQSQLLGSDLNTRSVDRLQHNIDLDIAVFELLQQHLEGGVFCATPNPTLSKVMDIAPKREGPPPQVRPLDPPDDWAGWAGLYPLAALRMLRSASRILRRA